MCHQPARSSPSVARATKEKMTTKLVKAALLFTVASVAALGQVNAGEEKP